MRHDASKWPSPRREMRFYDAMAGGDVQEPADMVVQILSWVLGGEVHPGVSWTLGAWKVTPNEVRLGRDEILIEFAAAMPGYPPRVGTLEIGVHSSGWLVAVVDIPPFPPEPFFIERVYEEFDIWPPDSPCEDLDCGRMSKRGRWLQLKPEYWPHLAFLARGSLITLDKPEDD